MLSTCPPSRTLYGATNFLLHWDFLRSLKQKIALLQHYLGLWQYCWWQLLSCPHKKHYCHHGSCRWATEGMVAWTVTPTILCVSLWCDVTETVSCPHSLLSFSLLLQLGHAELSQHTQLYILYYTDVMVFILVIACAVKEIQDSTTQKSNIFYLSKVTGGEESLFICDMLLDPLEWRDDTWLRRVWSSVPPGGALFSDKSTSETLELTCSHIPE